MTQEDETQIKLNIVSDLLRSGASGASGTTVAKQAEVIYNWVIGKGKTTTTGDATPVTEKHVPISAPVTDTPTPASADTTAPAPMVETPQKSPEELNDELSKEFTRLGGTEQNKAPMDLIFGVIKGFGVNNITTLPPGEYAAVLEKVRAL